MKPIFEPLRLRLSARVPLLKIDTVVAACGENAEIIKRHVEKGRLRWVFNVAVKPEGIRDLRFWNREISAFTDSERNELDELSKAETDTVIASILGQTEEFQPGEVCLLLGVRRPTLLTLELPRRRKKFNRQGLEQFLKARLLATASN
jgi:hypothetical protein